VTILLTVFGALCRETRVAAKRSWGKAYDCEARLLGHAHLTDISFVNVGLQLHLRQVAGQGEQHGGLEGGGDRLPDSDIAAQYDTVDRRAHRRLGDQCLLLVDLRLGRADRSPGAVIVALCGLKIPCSATAPIFCKPR